MANCCFAASNWQFRICGFDSRKQAKVITDNGLSKLSIKVWNVRKMKQKQSKVSKGTLNLNDFTEFYLQSSRFKTDRRIGFQ